MYLVEINKENGLVETKGRYDGLMIIKEFREVINDDAFGVQAFTCVALVMDWLSPIRYFTEEDRPMKAMKMITNRKDKYPWANIKIKNALKKYSELQYNPILVEKHRIDQLIMTKMQQINKEKNDRKLKDLFSHLKTFKELAVTWSNENEDIDPYADGPVENGYSLSRLEEKLADKNSFYNI